MPEPMNDNARIVRDFIVASCPNPERLLAALTALETELATAKDRETGLTKALAEVQADLARAREEAVGLREAGQMVLDLRGTGDSLVDAQFIIAAAIHPKDYDQTTRECVLGKALSAALAPEQKGE